MTLSGGGIVVMAGAEPGAEPGHSEAAPVRRRRRVVARAMLIAAPLLLVAYPLGALLADSTHLVILRRAFDGPAPYVAAAAILLIAGAVARPLPVIPLVLAVTIGVLALLGCLALGALFQGWAEDRTVNAPDGADRRAVTWHGSATIDPLYRVTIIQGTGPTAREWEAACLNADDPSRELQTVTWATPHRLLLTDAAGREYAVHLDPQSGRPRSTPIMDC